MSTGSWIVWSLVVVVVFVEWAIVFRLNRPVLPRPAPREENRQERRSSNLVSLSRRKRQREQS